MRPASLSLEPNRTKPRELGRIFPARHRAKSKIAPQLRGLVRRIFPPKAGILDRRGSLWVAILVRNPGKIPVFYGKILVFSLVVLTLFWT
jgi:hypothetical protein